MSQRLTRGRAARSNSAVLDHESDMDHQVAPAAAPRTRKRTRVTATTAPIPEDEVAPPTVTTTVAASTVTPTVAGSSATTTTTRRTRSLRSTVNNSPLKSLDSAPKPSSKRKRVVQKQTREQDLETKREQDELDPDGLFFQRKPPIYLHPESPLIPGKAKKIKVEVSDDEKLPMSANAPKPDSLLDVMALRAELQRVKQENVNLSQENGAIKAENTAIKAKNTAIQADYRDLKADYGAMMTERDSLKVDYGTMMTDRDNLRTAVNSLETKHENLKTEHQTVQDNLLNTQKELKTQRRYANNAQKALRELEEATAPKPDPNPKKVEPSPEALAILARIEKQRDDHLATGNQVATVNQNQDNDQQEQTDATTATTDATADDASREMDHNEEEPEQESSAPPAQDSPATPARAPVAQDATPQTRGWGFKSLISRLVPASFTSPAPAPVPTVAPATAPPAVLQPAQAQNLANTLQPTPLTPTPATERRRRTPGPSTSVVRAQNQAQRITQQRKPPSDARALVTCVANSVSHEDTHKAINWAKEAAQKLKLADPSTIGEKRKRIEAGVKMGDLKSFPARTPWQSAGTFSFHGELFDLDDDDLAPAWCVLQEMLDDIGIGSDSPSAKKRKTAQEDTTMEEEITPLNETDMPALTKSTSRPHINTHGNSASLSDLQPRSSRIPSPMFGDPSDRSRDGNIFTQQQQAPTKSTDEQKLDEEYMRQLRIKMRKEGEVWSTPGGAAQNEAYRMALRDQEEKDRKEAEAEAEAEAKKKAAEEAKKVPAEDAPLWTQQPPPAPTPAHASLPTPLAASPSVPPVQAEEPVLAPVSPPRDPVERQRAKLLKHTPARPSRLREATVPSPSVRSDFGDSPVQIVGGPWNFDIPDPEPLDLGDPELLLAVEALVASDEFKARNVGAYGGADVPLIYEEESEEE
jgi:hypothetical protein